MRKPIGIVVPSWNPNEPRFVVADATEHLSEDRKFVNGKCVENQRLKIVYSVEDIVYVLNNYEKLEKENEQLRQSVEYWQKKYEEGTETFTFPPNCDECDFLGNNGICGYCKFTLNCYDSKEDLIDGEVLPNCPLKPLINMNEQLREINKEIGDDLYNCRLNKNIISEKLKLWQNTLAEYNIYTIKDLSLQMKILKEENEQLKQEVFVYKKAFQEQVQRCTL